MHFHQQRTRACMPHKICMAIHGLSFTLLSLLLKHTTHCLTALTSAVWSPETFNEHSWMSVSAIFSAQKNSIPHLHFHIRYLFFCHTAPLLPSATQQQNVREYRWEGSISTAIPPISTSDITGQHNEIQGITFGAAPLVVWMWVCILEVERLY